MSGTGWCGDVVRNRVHRGDGPRDFGDHRVAERPDLVEVHHRHIIVRQRLIREPEINHDPQLHAPTRRCCSHHHRQPVSHHKDSRSTRNREISALGHFGNALVALVDETDMDTTFRTPVRGRWVFRVRPHPIKHGVVELVELRRRPHRPLRLVRHGMVDTTMRIDTVGASAADSIGILRRERPRRRAHRRHNRAFGARSNGPAPIPLPVEGGDDVSTEHPTSHPGHRQPGNPHRRHSTSHRRWSPRDALEPTGPRIGVDLGSGGIDSAPWFGDRGGGRGHPRDAHPSSTIYFGHFETTPATARGKDRFTPAPPDATGPRRPRRDPVSVTFIARAQQGSRWGTAREFPGEQGHAIRTRRDRHRGRVMDCIAIDPLPTWSLS